MNMANIQLVAAFLDGVTGGKTNIQDVIAEFGDHVLETLAHSYYTACKAYNVKPSKINCVQEILDARALDDEMAAKYGI